MTVLLEAAGQGPSPADLLRISNAVLVQQALYATAKLGVADLLHAGVQEIPALSVHLKVNGEALLRLLASQGIFEETPAGVFGNTALSEFLRTGVPDSVRSMIIFRGSDFWLGPVGSILYTLETGLPAREKLYGQNAFEHFKGDPETARMFDDAMTNGCLLLAPAIAAAYDFGQWGSLMDVGGGNGMLLRTILAAHPRLRGVLADLPHVLERARERDFLGGALASRSSMLPCDFFAAVPSGCRAYLMKSIIHDWGDERAVQILTNCRRAVPDDGALLLAESALPDSNRPAPGRFSDVLMMLLTGGRERSVHEYRALLARASFCLTCIVPVPGEFSVIEARPV